MTWGIGKNKGILLRILNISEMSFQIEHEYAITYLNIIPRITD